MDNNNPTTIFTDAHIAELEKHFPEDSSFGPEAYINHQRGKRSVVLHMKMLVAQAKNRGRVK